MTYNLIKQRLENNDIIILDGAIGAELEKKGAKARYMGLDQEFISLEEVKKMKGRSLPTLIYIS